MKNIKFYRWPILNLVASFIAAGTVASAAELPKLTLATCKVPKATIASWFYADSSGKSLGNVVEPMTLELKHMNLAGKPGIANYYRISVKGYNKAGKVAAQRELDQVAVNYSAGVYSVGYAPFSVSATATEPFSLLIEGKGHKLGAARGKLAVVPLQSDDKTPFEASSFDCELNRAPSKPIHISAKEVLALSEAGQFELLHNLQRLGFASWKSRKKAGTLVDAQVLAKVKEQLADIFDKRELPPVREYQKDYVIVDRKSDRCGSVTIDSAIPIYDAVTYRALHDGKESVANRQVGYILWNIDCKNAARTYKSKDGRVSDSNWGVNNVIITTKGLIEGYELAADEPTFY